MEPHPAALLGPWMHELEGYIRRARVFVSSAAGDAEEKRSLVGDLRDEGFRVSSGSDISPGSVWREEITSAITDAYALVVVWSKTAENSPWVNSEIGFARGRGIPEFFACVTDSPPRGISEDVQAAPLEDAARSLRGNLPDMLKRKSGAVFAASVVPDPPSRARRLAELAENLKEAELLRQVAVFSSFGIPEEDPKFHPGIWNDREGSTKRAEEHRMHQHEERVGLQRHAAEVGARLVICPQQLRRGPVETRARLATLRCFLDARSATRTAVHLADQVPRGNQTILGDRFYAESRAPGLRGFAHTVLTSHVPTVLNEIKRFDKSHDWPKVEDLDAMRASRESAIRKIDELLGNL